MNDAAMLLNAGLAFTVVIGLIFLTARLAPYLNKGARVQGSPGYDPGLMRVQASLRISPRRLVILLAVADQRFLVCAGGAGEFQAVALPVAAPDHRP